MNDHSNRVDPHRETASEEFDYIVVGSGPGGGPLAARLALAGKRVLLLEAGGDPQQSPPPPAFPQAGTGEIHEVPGYHAAATEDPSMAWMFSVRHFENDEIQSRDEKYNRSFDPNTPVDQSPHPIPQRFIDPPASPSPGAPGKRGIFYPRSSGLGGCTGHHAMIMAAPNDKDWDHIANLTGDDTWRASQMRGYFAKIEKCEYAKAYGKWFRQFFGWFFVLWQKLVLLLNPRAILDEGGHGKSGWQPTNFLDPSLVESIARKDRTFFNVLTGTVISVLERNRPLVGMLKRALFHARVVPYLDPNDYNTRRTKPEGVFLIPCGISGRTRTGLREHLLNTQKALEAKPESKGKLVIEYRVHVTRLLFAVAEGEAPPRAVGVEARRGDHLYEASPMWRSDAVSSTGESTPVYFFTRGEVVLCGGAFNTPQLLMLSGIGPASHLEKAGVQGMAIRVDDPQASPRSFEVVESGRFLNLPGVGANLQDRYEVSVISELNRDFATLAEKKISFIPGDVNDEGAREWRRSRGGLYGTNGGTLAVLRRSSILPADVKEPDTFSFGAPAAFRGYYWGWSRELLKRTMGAAENQYNLWSWIILKAYTDNSAGTVRLRSANPFATPEICFHSFEEGPTDGARLDLRALAESVKFFREVNASQPRVFVNEVQPGDGIANDSPEMDDWIRTQAWGHHACGTCRIGSDEWVADPQLLNDHMAVLDSKFRVHGVRGLRIVDASVFPKIPGYFILTPILMVSEKAADTLLSEPWDTAYPSAIREIEAQSIERRRLRAGTAELASNKTPTNSPPSPLQAPPQNNPLSDSESAPSRLPDRTVGLALSGGGIRSATFALGVLQALAHAGRLKHIDILSGVSGGGFIASFLGRLFTRKMVSESAAPAERVEELLKTPSAPLYWLRTHANYIFNAGTTDVRQNLGLYLRNTLSVHLVVGALAFGLFGVLRYLGDMIGGWLIHLRGFPDVWNGIIVSPWWGLTAALFVFGVVPATLGYWLAPKSGSRRIHPPYPLFAVATLMVGSFAVAAQPGMLLAGGVLAATLILAWVWQEAARWGTPEDPAKQGVVVRNRLTRALGDVLILFLASLIWWVIDSLARSAAGSAGSRGTLMALTAALAPLLPLFRLIAQKAAKQLADITGQSGSGAVWTGLIMGYLLALFLALSIDVLSHWVVNRGGSGALLWIALALAFSACLGRAFDFLNLSTLQTSYSARLGRTFLGASNEARLFGSQDENSGDVQLAHPADDIALRDYHPENHGGPLHLINICVNESVDGASEREVRDRKGLPMCLGPAGVSVGRRYHALWSVPNNLSKGQRWRRWIEGMDTDARHLSALRPLLPSNDPNAFHVLAHRAGETAPVESLSLGNWTGISGGAFSTGLGRGTKPGLALFMGLVNVRLGHWWDSGIADTHRPGQYPASLWRRLKHIPSHLFKMQSVLFAEWRGRFPGPSVRLWHLSDGGHFEVTGLYELIRRRLPMMIVSDAALDPTYQWEDLARMSRQVRQDFNASITWMDPRAARASNPDAPPWAGFKCAPDFWIQSWLRPDAIGALEEIFTRTGSKGKFSAALGCVEYGEITSPFATQHHRAPQTLEAPPSKPAAPSLPPAKAMGWILLLKASLDGHEPQDVRAYATSHASFPQDSTRDQVYDDEQWESYRALGQHVAERAIQ